MKQTTLKNKTGWLAALGAIALLACGCETVTRENIISSIDTGFGATVMENKQTQVPEIKVGYIRTQFYSVPTGKVVKNATYKEGNGTNQIVHTYGDHQTNAANITPNMVAGIRTESDFQSLIFGLKISENFAVGDVAVKSDAATAMYIANAKDSKTAQAASDAVRQLPKGTFTAAQMQTSADVFEQYQAITDPAIKAKWDGVLTNATDKKDIKDLVKTGTPDDWDNVGKILKARGLLK